MRKTIEWINAKDFGGVSRMVDQTLIPYEYKHVDIKTLTQMHDAIKTMVVRGAPAIGIAGAHGVALGAIELFKKHQHFDNFKKELLEKCEYLNSSRPTAVNLRWAIDEQIKVINMDDGNILRLCKSLIQNAIDLENEDVEINKAIGEHGSAIIPKGATILTHCNAGALATVAYGTALGVVRSAYAKDTTIKVFADETRPRQQGAKITTFELLMDGIPTTLLTDGMCSYFMSRGEIDVVVVGADRIAGNGDTANKIGTCTLAVCAKYFNVPFYIAAPRSTIDFNLLEGSQIPIELRDEEEVTHINGQRICAEGVSVINPSFDVTPNELIEGIITEYGIIKPYQLRDTFEGLGR